MAEANDSRLRSTLGVFGTAFRNRSLLRVELAWLAFNSAEWGVWLALLEQVPRTATVTAMTDAELFSLTKEPYILALTGYAPSARAAGGMVSRASGRAGGAAAAQTMITRASCGIDAPDDFAFCPLCATPLVAASRSQKAWRACSMERRGHERAENRLGLSARRVTRAHASLIMGEQLS